jgi:hypothetical protein
VKFVLALALLGILGLPILELWQMLVLVAAWIALACSTLRLTRWRLAAAVGIAAVTLAVAHVLPHAGIDEGHNIFIVTDDNDVLSGLPGPIYEKWRLLFEQQFPADEDPDAFWHHTPPLTLYADSSDALWSPARYSRQVDTVAFQNLTEFRGGFANAIRYNFFGNDALSLSRGFEADLPFFVMYEFSPASVGSTMFWRGIAFWERTDGSFEEIAHATDSGRLITPSDSGKKLYALHLPPPLSARPWEKAQQSTPPPLTALAMHLELRPGLVLAGLAASALRLVAVCAVLLLLTRIDAREDLIAFGIVALSFIVVGVALHFSEGKYLGPAYPPHGAGDDGLTHESTGRTMARALMSGDWKEALRGGQSVYFDTPGMRYVRCVEKIIFGDTNLGYMAFVGLLPWFVYLLVRFLAGALWATAATVIFFLSPFGSLSFVQYIQNAKLGYAEAVSFGLFILGFFLFARSQARWGGHSNGVSAFFGGLCLAGAMFVRPNLALAVPVLGSLFIFASWRSRDFKTMMAAMAGLAFALWMPLHNYLYGHQFVLISAAGATISVPLSPITYLRALGEVVAGNVRGEYVEAVTSQLTGWLRAQPRIPVASLRTVAAAFLLLRLVTLAVTVVAAFRYLREGGARQALAWSALAAHLPMLFIFASGQFRYAMIAWDLCAILTLVVIADYRRATSGRSRNSTARPV